jgi:hypothetical protein
VADDTGSWPLRTAPDEVTALELSRLAVPVPSMLNSVNQIGFDFYDWLAGTVATSPDRTLLWVVGARRDGAGRLVADPSAGFAFPLVGPRQGATFRLTSPGVTLTFTFGPVPLETFALDGRFDADGVVAPDASMAARVVCADVPGYEALLPLTGMCNPEGVIPVVGGYLASVAESPAATRPDGLQASPPVGRVEGGTVILQVDLDVAAGSRYPASEHAVHLLVLDEDGEPVGLDYPAATLVEESASGDVDRVTLTAPTGSLPESGEVVVMADVFPLARFPLPR